MTGQEMDRSLGKTGIFLLTSWAFPPKGQSVDSDAVHVSFFFFFPQVWQTGGRGGNAHETA